MKYLPTVRFAVTTAVLSVQALAYQEPVFPYPPAAEEPLSTAVPYTDPGIAGWAQGVVSLVFGAASDDATFQDPQSAVGPSSGGGADVLVLGRGGEVTLQFDPLIRDLPGRDFAVFENGFSDTFLELAFVEVSSDGIHWVRFPNYSVTPEPVGTWGLVQASFVHGLAGKYRAGYGTPFDLADLDAAYTGVLQGYSGFSAAFETQLLDNFPFVDIGAIRYVRLIDVPGDGTAEDCQGFTIYDPYPTFITAGFDLDAIGVFNQGSAIEQSFSEWASVYGLADGPDADPDRDGWSNLLEYHFATDPQRNGSTPVFWFEQGPDGESHVYFWRNSRSMGSLELFVSAEFQEWVSVSVGPYGRFDSSGDRRLGGPIVLPAEQPFFRFVAELP